MNPDNVMLRIFTQYTENGKQKGGIEFELEINLYMYMYEEERCVKAIQQLLKEHSNDYCQYTYISSEPIFHKPVALCTPKRFEEVVTEIYNAEPKDEAEERALNEDVDFLLGK